MLLLMTMASSVAALSMNFWKLQGKILKARKKEEIAQILPYGKTQPRNISCGGNLPGVKDFPAGILSALQWQQNTWVHSLIYMVAEWTCNFLIMKARSHKVP